MSHAYSVEILIQVLDRILMTGAQITEDHVTQLVKYVTGIPGDHIDRESLYNIIRLWLLQTIELSEKELPNPAVLTLALNFTVFLSSEEEWFLELNENNALERFIKILKLELQNIGATPDVGYVRLMMCVLNHKAGCSWMMSTSYSSEILNLTMRSAKDSDIGRAGTKFISKLISECLDINKEFCTKFISTLISPIIQFAGLIRNRISITKELFNENCMSSVNVFQNVVDTFFDETNSKKFFEIFEEVTAVIELFEYHKHALELCHKSPSDDITFNLLNLQFMLCFTELLLKTKDTPSMTYSKIEPFIDKFEVIKKKLLPQFLKLYPNIMFSWLKYNSKVRNLTPKIIMKDGTVVSLGETLIFYQLMPIYYISLRFHGPSNFSYFSYDQLRENVAAEHMKKALPIFFYQFYQFREYMEDQFSYEYSVTSIQFILNSKNYYSRAQANTALQILIYCFEDLSQIIATDPQAMKTCHTKMNYLGCVMKAIKVIITEFDIKWQDTLETMTLMEITLTILSMTGWIPHVVVNGLDLISVAFSKHLSLNMAFFTDQFDGDVIEKIIEICTQKMNDQISEIRCSAVKVIASISNNVTEDFSSFKSLILENYLPMRIFELAIHDKDYIVRASAIKCLQEMAKVDDFWNYVMQSYDIYEHVCQILHEEQHHSVRSEAATLTAIIYEQHHLFSEVLMKFYATLSYSVTEDTHPEVRRNALQFWKIVIQRHLSMQGMIDGAFPEVTFSKDSRKIVVLNDSEVRSRLSKVLYQLSETGCLYSLRSALEDCDREVRVNVKDIVSDFYDLLKRYEVDIADLESYSSKNLSEQCFDVNIVESEFNYELKRQHVLLPGRFLDYVKDYFRSTQNTTEVSDTLLNQTILQEILCQDPYQRHPTIADY